MSFSGGRGSLDPKYLQIAAKELNESPDQTYGDIARLRLWLTKSKHISGCPTDDRFLLRFLRAAKFDQEKARKKLENFCTVRASKTRGVPSGFVYPDVNHESVAKTLRLGIQIPLGYNEQGEFLVLVRQGAWDPDVIDYESMRPIVHMGADAMMDDERLQIAGVHVILDMEEKNKATSEFVFQLSTLKENVKIWQDGYPFRLKGFYFYREPLIFDIIFHMMKLWIGAKMIRLMHRLGDDLERLHEKCPGAKQLLPKEYGGQAGTVAECIKRWERRFREYWATGQRFDQLRVNESKRPEDSLKYLKQYEDLPTDIFGGPRE